MNDVHMVYLLGILNLTLFLLVFVIVLGLVRRQNHLIEELEDLLRDVRDKLNLDPVDRDGFQNLFE